MELALIFIVVWLGFALLSMTKPNEFEFPAVTFLLAILIGAMIIF